MKTRANRWQSPALAMASGISAVSLAFASPTNASDLCTDVSRLVVQAQENFTENNRQIAPPPLSGAESCSMTLALSGARAYHCAWPFPFRSDDAQSAFTKINDALAQCFGDRTEAGRDQGVNHPDSYDQRQYPLDRAMVTASIKDKSAQQKTYVFIGVHGPARE